MAKATRAWGVLLIGLCGAVAPLRADDGLAPERGLRGLEPAAGPRIAVVEMPAPQRPLAGPTRPHHALSFRAEAPKRWLNAIGIEATDCATRVRFPSRLRQNGGSVQAEVAAQVHFSCRF